MNRILSILLFTILLLCIVPNTVFATVNDDLATVRDISGFGGAVDVTYMDGKYYAITPTSILVSSDTKSWNICYENIQYQLSKIDTLNNQIIIINYGQSNSEILGTYWYTNIITSLDGINFITHQTMLKKYSSIAFCDGVYYLSYYDSDGYYVDSTTDFESYTTVKIFTGEYFSSPNLIIDENKLYMYSSGISGTLLYQFTDGNWTMLKNDTNIVASRIECIGGILYGVMIKKSIPRETWLYCFENNAWVGVCKLFDGESVNGVYFLDDCVVVTTWDNTSQSEITYLSSTLLNIGVNFSKSTSDLFSSTTYYAKLVNEKCFVFNNGELPKISIDIKNYQSIGTPILEQIQIATGNNTILMTTGDKLYSLNKVNGEMTELHPTDTIGYHQIFFINGQFYIFATDYDSNLNKVYTTSNGITLEEKSFIFFDTDKEQLVPNYMEILQFEFWNNSFKILLDKGDGYTQLFESENGTDFIESSARYLDMFLENVVSYAFGSGNSVTLTYDGYNSTLYYFEDGVTYETSTIENDVLISGVIYDENQYIAYGYNEKDGPAVYTSDNGITFTRQPINIDIGKIVQLIKVENGYYIILHNYKESKALLYSEDLQTFTFVKNNLYYGYCRNSENEFVQQLEGYYRFTKGEDTLLCYSLDGMIYQKTIVPISKYTVTYSLNGGSGTIEPSKTYNSGKGFTVSVIVPQKTNYTFKGWSDGQNIYQPGTDYPTGKTDVMLTAVWEENAKYVVNYNANGGSGNIPENTMYYVNTSFTITSMVPTFANHTFVGWNDGQNIYQKGAVHLGSDRENITLTAVWQENGKYVVTYNLNGISGTTPDPQSYYVDTGFTITSIVPTKEHYTFLSWSDGINTYLSGANYPVGNKNVTLTAVWQEEVKYSVTYNLNGGSSKVPSVQSYYTGDKVTIETAPTRTDYVFKGWLEGITLYQPNDVYTMLANDVILIAQWENIPIYTANFIGGDGTVGDAPESKNLTNGKLFTLPENTFSKVNCTFLGWSDGKTIYQPKQSYTMPEKNITFIAVWDENPEYRVYVHNGNELIDALNNAPYSGDVGTIIFANDITNFSEINLALSGSMVQGGTLQKQNIVLDLQGYTLSGDDYFGQYFTNAGTVKITGTKGAKLENCTIYTKKYSSITIENITVTYRAKETEHIDLFLNEGNMIFKNCKIDLDYIDGKCGDGSSLTAVRNLPSGIVYVIDGTNIDVHTSSGDIMEGHKDGIWYGIENLGTVYVRGGMINSSGPAIFNGSGIYYEQQVRPQTILTEGHLNGGLAVSKAYYDNKDNLHYTIGEYTISDGSYIELHNFNPTTGMFTITDFTDVDICKIIDNNIISPKFTKNLSSEYVYIQNQKITPLSVSVNVDSFNYTWYKNTENTIIGATMVSTEKAYTPSTVDKGTFYYFVVVQSAQYVNGQIFRPIIISNSAKVSVISVLSDKPINLNHYTGITLDAEVGLLPNNTVMQITPTTEGENFTLVSGAMDGVADKFIAFEITLLSSGVEIQPNDKVKIRIPIPNDFGTENLIVYYVNSDGSKTSYNVKVVDNFAEFETDHFSLYLLAVKVEAELPQTEDRLPILTFILLVSLFSLIVIGLMVYKKCYRNKKNN